VAASVNQWTFKVWLEDGDFTFEMGMTASEIKTRECCSTLSLVMTCTMSSLTGLTCMLYHHYRCFGSLPMALGDPGTSGACCMEVVSGNTVTVTTAAVLTFCVAVRVNMQARIAHIHSVCACCAALCLHPRTRRPSNIPTAKFPTDDCFYVMSEN
jgi:hypothetical protein